MDYGAALEMRFGETRRGFESLPLRHSLASSIHGAPQRGDLGNTGTLPGAVLGGELAVPCTCNPLQQG